MPELLSAYGGGGGLVGAIEPIGSLHAGLRSLITHVKPTNYQNQPTMYPNNQPITTNQPHPTISTNPPYQSTNKRVDAYLFCSALFFIVIAVYRVPRSVYEGTREIRC
jgi:hypothetical protein